MQKGFFLKKEMFESIFKDGHRQTTVFPISNGSRFHSVGAATERDVAPYVFKL